MNPRRKNRMFLAIAILIGMAVTISLVLYALRSNIDLFYTPGEVVYGKGEDKIKPEPGQRLRIGGMVMPGSVVRDPTSLKVTFKVYDARAAIDVRYDGILPDLFREDQSVVAQGVYGEDDVIIAKEVLAKHDENYMPPEVEEAMKGNHQRPAESYKKEAEMQGKKQ